jgi:hypothetical protein
VYDGKLTVTAGGATSAPAIDPFFSTTGGYYPLVHVTLVDADGQTLNQGYARRCLMPYVSIDLKGIHTPVKALLSTPARAVEVKIPLELHDVTFP